MHACTCMSPLDHGIPYHKEILMIAMQGQLVWATWTMMKACLRYPPPPLPLHRAGQCPLLPDDPHSAE